MPGVIKPEDFSSRVTDPNRHRWTLGTIEHVVTAMKGRPALVEVDNRTGCSFTGEIVGYSSSGSRNPGARLHFVSDIGGGSATWYLLSEVGVIVDMTPHGNAKWDALRMASNARMAALDAARAKVTDADPYAGTWEITAGGFGRYHVHRTLPDEKSYAGKSWEITLS